MPLDAVTTELRAFVAEPDWAQFHSPANLAKSISIEAGELLEFFQWSDDGNSEQAAVELADVLTYCTRRRPSTPPELPPRMVRRTRANRIPFRYRLLLPAALASILAPATNDASATN